MPKALMLRTCRKDNTSRDGFVWPESGPVEAPDWNPEPECGGGLHGLLWGEGRAGDLAYSVGKYQVVEIDEWVRIEQKIKAPRGVVVYSGERDGAIDYLLANGAADKAVVFARKTGGYGSTLTGGDYSVLTGGHGSTLTGGHGSTLTGGDCSTLTGGDYSTLTGGHYSVLTGGYGSVLTGGYRSTLCWRVWDGARYRLHVRYVGEDGIKLGTPYRFAGGQVVEVRDV